MSSLTKRSVRSTTTIPGKEFSWEMVNARLVEHPAFQERARNHLQVREQQAGKTSELDQEYDDQERQQREARYNQVQSHAFALRENRAPAQLLHHLATAYFGDYIDVEGDTPRDRLLNLLEGDGQLVDAAIAAFRLTTIRSDLPDESEIVRLASGSEVHYLSCPFMAGLEELDPAELEEGQIRLALTIPFQQVASGGEDRVVLINRVAATRPGCGYPRPDGSAKLDSEDYGSPGTVRTCR